MKRELWNSVALALAVVLIGAGGPWLVRQLRSLPHAGALAARSDQRIVTLDVAGMTCEGCAASVKGRLAEVSGVRTVEVRLGQRRAYVVAEKALPDSALTAAVRRAGPGFAAAVVQK